ncbi:glycoside hydrolase family 99-like domain-containing protein [Ferrovum sp.]|uniref:glycoside hydrolase family 99-like domain-containing protein n=1 Tax=Ferrovum sp. TaxID=2609467 RepID=UPI0026132ED1|nr:glycoside hydrolase family 99-like domain-containing protein [Ferrovum sp.]
MERHLNSLRSWIGIAWIVIKRPKLFSSFFQVVRLGGWGYAIALTARKLGLGRNRFDKPQAYALSMRQKEKLQREKFRTVPFYLSPSPSEALPLTPRKIAVHLHLYYDDMTEVCIQYLKHIPLEFDLFVSVPGKRAVKNYLSRFKQEIPRVNQVIIENVPNRGRDIAPFIIQFGTRLTDYDYIAHFHTKKSPHATNLEGWFNSLMNQLCGSENGIRQILRLLEEDARAVYPAGNKGAFWDATGWLDNHEIARSFLFTHDLFDIDDFPFVEFPQGGMFWAKTSCLKQFLSLPLSYQDFPEEPIPADATLAHALERLILMFTTTSAGRNYRLETPELSYESQEYHEEQNDYSDTIVHHSIKVLAYYQPRFFSSVQLEGAEWNRVRSATPIFEGHYQQHVPHEDLGYYDRSAGLALLEKQAGMMQKSGMQGFVFHLEWQNGSPVFEQPVAVLRASPRIALPYCFCWTGNDGQNLDQSDLAEHAPTLIDYLIPFFRDPRYLKVAHRPMVLIRAAGTQGFGKSCQTLWHEECERQEIQPPFLVGSLDFGEDAPANSGFDAFVEQWQPEGIEKDVPTINQDLYPYWTLKAPVFDYEAVVDHHTRQFSAPSLPCFRSLVPSWDGMARPQEASGAILHRSTPKKMQKWLTQLIVHTETHLPPDRRFILVDAWNEWGRGAHLEPDLKYGYGYLNSVGRSLCDYPYDGLDYIEPAPELHLEFILAPIVSQRLQSEPTTRKYFLQYLAQFCLTQGFQLTIHNFYIASELQALGVRCNERIHRKVDFIIEFSEPVIFPQDSFIALVKMGLRHRGFLISATPCNDPDFIHEETAPNFSIGYWQRGEIYLRPPGVWKGSKVCLQAIYFKVCPPLRKNHQKLEKVATIVRFHRGAVTDILMRSLYSLLAQADCRVQPWLALQDLTDEETDSLRRKLEGMPWSEECRPMIRRYTSSPNTPDVRSLMLNDTIKAIGKGYVAFLDYDDILFSHAYRTLLARLENTNKNATFGRVFSTTVDAETGMILSREKNYTLGLTYQDYLHLNHAPLHSFMLNLNLIDLTCIHYFDDMKFLEDYYLTMQIFSAEKTDWASLQDSIFIGDYIHRRGDKEHTLALSDSDRKNHLLEQGEYRLCEERVAALRRQILDALPHGAAMNRIPSSLEPGNGAMP